MAVNTNAPRNVIPTPTKTRPDRSIMTTWGRKAVLPALAFALAVSALAMWIMQSSTPAVAPRVTYNPVSGGFAATVPSIPGYNAPYSVRAAVPVKGGFATTVPLIPGYNIPYNMAPDLWRVITTRAGFDVYEGRPAVVTVLGNGTAQC